MRIKETKIGGGLSRFDVEPMCCSERNIPTEIVDEMVRDIIKRKQGETCFCGRNDYRHNSCKRNYGCGCNERYNIIKPMREPDGIDVHVDRPVRENFFTFEDWRRAMMKYRNLEDAAKICDWECREPMKGTCDSFKHCYEFDDFDIFDEDEEEDEDDFGLSFYGRW